MADVIAHRGLRSECPENTIVSVEQALRITEIYGVEFDVELSGDGRPMVLHQETVTPDSFFKKLEPATRNYTSRDYVVEHSEAEIALLDAGSWFGSKFSDSRVPRLRDILELDWREHKAFIELKDATYWGQRDLLRPSQIVDAVLNDIRAFKGEVNIISFNPQILSTMGSKILGIGSTLALWTDWQGKQSEAIDSALHAGAKTISLADVMVLECPEWVSRSHEKGLELHVYPVSPAPGEPEFLTWTASSQVEKWGRLVSLGADALVSDFSRETVEFLKSST